MKTIIVAAALASSVPVAAAAMATLTIERPSWFIFQSSSGIDEPFNTVVRDEATWVALWGRMHARMGPFRPAPHVDFSKRMVLVTALGQRPTGGSSIRIASVANGPREITATVVRSASGRGCGVTMAFTQPTDLVVVPTSSKPVHWRFRNNSGIRC